MEAAGSAIAIEAGKSWHPKKKKKIYLVHGGSIRKTASWVVAELSETKTEILG